MTQIHIETRGFDRVERNYSKSKIIVFGALNRSLRRIGTVLVPALKRNTPVRSGKLRNSTRFQIKGTRDDQALDVRQGARTEKGVIYRPFVTGGTRPHEIRPVTAKALRFNVGGRVVFAKKVNHPGTKPNPFHVKTLNEELPVIQSILDEEGVSVTAELSR